MGKENEGIETIIYARDEAFYEEKLKRYAKLTPKAIISENLMAEVKTLADRINNDLPPHYIRLLEDMTTISRHTYPTWWLVASIFGNLIMAAALILKYFAG